MHMIIKDVNTLVCRVIVLIIGVLEYWSNEINTVIQIQDLRFINPLLQHSIRFSTHSRSGCLLKIDPTAVGIFFRSVDHESF